MRGDDAEAGRIRRARRESALEREVRREIEGTFELKRGEIGVDAVLDLSFIDDMPVVGEAIYAEAFPFERPPRVKMEVFAPDATSEGIRKNVCEELLHVKHPEIEEHTQEFWGMVGACARRRSRHEGGSSGSAMAAGMIILFMALAFGLGLYGSKERD